MEALLALLKTAGTVAGSAVAIKALFASGSNNQTNQQAQVLAAITPSVVNQLQNRGLSLPAGQESQYVQAALSGNLQPAAPDYILPLAIGGFALFLLMGD